MGQKRERDSDSLAEKYSITEPVPLSASEATVGEERGEISSDLETEKKQVNRCSGCRRKVGLIGFRCRCGDVFCWEHRYSDRHDCGFDYKASGRAAIARENPVVRPAKILKV
ncbi:hypothetical protein QQ045_004385 [Rhodiola kirilowii]